MTASDLGTHSIQTGEFVLNGVPCKRFSPSVVMNGSSYYVDGLWIVFDMDASTDINSLTLVVTMIEDSTDADEEVTEEASEEAQAE